MNSDLHAQRMKVIRMRLSTEQKIKIKNWKSKFDKNDIKWLTSWDGSGATDKKPVCNKDTEIIIEI